MPPVPDLAALYGEEFFREWGSTNERYTASARTIAEVIHREFRPRRLADIGSGSGVYSHLFREMGVEVLSIDGVIPPPAHAFAPPDVVQDLRVPFENVWGAFDLVLCLEVAEHIPEASAGVFLRNLERFGDLLVFSHAPERQGGIGHVNEKPKRYWIGKLAGRGFAYDRPTTGVLMETWKREKPAFMWMAEHICVFRRSRGPGGGA